LDSNFVLGMYFGIAPVAEVNYKKRECGIEAKFIFQFWYYMSLCETKSSVTKELFVKLFLVFFLYVLRWYCCSSKLAGVHHL
jgi:hypothetical protein